MKKIIFIVLILTVLGFAATAFAQGYGGGYGGGYGKHHGKGMHNGYWGGNNGMMYNNQQQFKNLTADEAKAKVQEYIKSNNLKGYTLGTVNTYTNPRGYNMFTVDVKDSGGNALVFHVNPYGYVMGPMVKGMNPYPVQ